MAVSDREIDRVLQFGLEDFDWFRVVVELATGRCRDSDTPARETRPESSGEE